MLAGVGVGVLYIALITIPTPTTLNTNRMFPNVTKKLLFAVTEVIKAFTQSADTDTRRSSQTYFLSAGVTFLISKNKLIYLLTVITKNVINY